MLYSDLFRLSTRMFKARTGRTLLTIFGMGIGIGAVFFLVALGFGLQKLLLENITTSDSLLALDVLPGKAEGAALDPGRIDEMKNLAGVAEIVPVVDIGSQIRYKGIATDASAVISDPDFLKLDGKKIILGAPFRKESSREVVISSALPKIFGVSNEEMLGKEIGLALLVPGKNQNGKKTFEKWEAEAPFKIAGFVESEEMILFANPRDFGSIFPRLEYSRLKIKAKSGADVDQVKAKFSEEKYSVSSLSETVAEVNKMFDIVKIVLALFGMVSLSVSAIGMFNTMTVTFLERTKEIGIMKSIGASRKDILLIFILESTIMGFLGGAAGLALGILTGTIFNSLVNLIAWRFGGKPVALFSYPLWFLLFILGFAILIGFLTGIVPARRASRIDPLEALRSR